MYFDYTIVLAFAVCGALLAIAKARVAARGRPELAGEERIDPERGRFDRRHFGPALGAVVFGAGALLLLPFAVVLRDCLHDTGAAQSRGIGTLALVEGGLFLAVLGLGLLYVAKRGARESTDPTDPAPGRSP